MEDVKLIFSSAPLSHLLFRFRNLPLREQRNERGSRMAIGDVHMYSNAEPRQIDSDVSKSPLHTLQSSLYSSNILSGFSLPLWRVRKESLELM